MTGETALRERAELLDELRQIVQSMKNLAFAELQRLTRLHQAMQPAVEAVAQGLAALPDDEVTLAPAGPAIGLVIAAERGFCGAFNAQILSQACDWLQADPARRLLIGSRRLYTQLGETQAGLLARVQSVPGCAASDELDAVVNDWLGPLSEVIAAAPHRPIALLHRPESGPVWSTLWPTQRPPAPRGTAPQVPPQLTLPAPRVRHALQTQMLRLQVQHALIASLEQENHWRLAQMQRARDHLDEMGDKLRRRYASLRQTHITGELQTLMGAESAQRSPR